MVNSQKAMIPDKSVIKRCVSHHFATTFLFHFQVWGMIKLPINLPLCCHVLCLENFEPRSNLCAMIKQDFFTICNYSQVRAKEEGKVWRKKRSLCMEPAGWTNLSTGRRPNTEELFMSKTSPLLKLTGKQHGSATHSLICRTRLRPEDAAEDHGPLWWWPRIIHDNMQWYTVLSDHTKQVPIAPVLCNQSARDLTFIMHDYHWYHPRMLQASFLKAFSISSPSEV